MGKAATVSADARWLAFAEFVAMGKPQQEAYRLAGYKCGRPATVAAAASRLAKNVKVRELIEEAKAKVSTERIATAQEIQEIFTDIARATLSRKQVDNEGVTVESGPAFADRIKAAELLGKIKGLFIEKTKAEGHLEIIIRRGKDAPSAINRKE